MYPRPLFETFEPRRLMTVIAVTTLADSGPGSLRQAINASAPGDTIDATQITGKIVNAIGTFNVNKNLTLLGPGEDKLTVDGNGADHVFVVNNGATFNAQSLTIIGGNTKTSGGGLLNKGMTRLTRVSVKANAAYLYGGGIDSVGAGLTLIDCTIEGNTAAGALEASGGGIYMDGGTLTMVNTTVSNNKAIGQSNIGLIAGIANGGGVYLNNTADSSMINCTFGNNTAQGGNSGTLAMNGQAFGGAIYTKTTHATTLNHVTIAHNTAAGGGNPVLNTVAASQGGGVYSAQNTTGVTLKDSITALNAATTSPDLIGGLVNTLGGNLVGAVSGASVLNTLIGDRFGTALAPLAPGLDPVLAVNGGRTKTFALTSSSPAVDAAATDGPTTDQRGLGRRGTPDTGAYELNPNHLPIAAAPTSAATAGVVYTQGLAVVDADDDAVVITSPDLPKFLKIQTVGGVPTLVGTPTEYDYGQYKITLNASDGFQSSTTTFKLKVNIPGIDLTDGLLRLNGSEFDDVLTVTPIKGGKVRVYRDGFKRDYAANLIERVQVFGFGGDDEIAVSLATPVAVVAGDGKDTVTTGDGADTINGGGDNDEVHGGAGVDRLFGDAGDDALFGDGGNDVVHGNSGRDTVDGGTGSNRLYGDEDNDFLVSNRKARDVLYGGEGKNSGRFDKKDRVADQVLSA